MLQRLPAPLTGVIVSTVFLINLIFWAIPVYVFIILKLIPVRPWQRWCTDVLHVLCGAWLRGNVLFAESLLGARWEITGTENLRNDKQYVVICNHQTWNDIYVLMRVMGLKVPFFKFFIKQELIWVPILGPVWWALDYPFMKRYSREQIAANPALAGEDLRTARQACSKYKGMPVTVLNFLEGTRFTPAKHDRQNSPYRHLLRPRSGGLALAVAALGNEVDALLDVSIAYVDGACGFWDFMCGRMRHVIVDVREHPIAEHWFTGDYQGDEEFRAEFQRHIAEIWQQKDEWMDEVLAAAR